jgi:hypothetical protein
VENGNPIARAETLIAIASDMSVASSVTTDRISYAANETATVMSRIISESQNYIFENLTATITISDSQLTMIHTENHAIPMLLPGQLIDLNTYWNTSTYPPGDYPASLEVRDASGNVLSSSTVVITIASDIQLDALLIGQISVDNQSLFQGDPVAITYSVTNVGNVDLSLIDLSILTVHVVELTAYDTLTDQASLLMGETFTNTQQLATQSYSAKDYLVILRASVSGVEETLASTYFRVEGAPSAPSLNAPPHGEDVETLTPALTVNNASDPNDDNLTYEFELYSDSGLTNLIASSGTLTEGINTTSWQVPLELVENAVYTWRSRAYDGLLYGDWMTPAEFRVNVVNDPPTAPTLSSPADGSEVDTLMPSLAVNNAYDPDSENLTYNFEVALDSDFIQQVTFEIGIFEGEGTTAWLVPINLIENTYYYWRAQADDWFIDGPWMTPAGFFVNTANDAPTAPEIISPAHGSEITTLSADITVTNSTDPDSADLSYLFEIDTVPTFDSPDLTQSGSIAEGLDTTTWHANSLNDNTWYYARAKASDGLAESPWSGVAEFFVNTINDAPAVPVLSNPSDGGAVTVFNPTLTVHNATDIDGDVLTYDFEIYEDEAMTTLVSSVTDIIETDQITSWTLPVTLTENASYYWRAQAFDGELQSGWMPLASFMVNTANDAPSAPALHSPAEGSSLDILNPTLSIYNAEDPDSDGLSYNCEIFADGSLIHTITDIPENPAGITSVVVNTPLNDNTSYTWRANAYDGDRYGAWMEMASFSIHLPVLNITATIDFDPNTLNQTSNGKWVVVYIELPEGYDVADIDVSTVLLGETIPAQSKPYNIGDEDHDGIPDLMVKFRRSDVIDLLPSGENVQVFVTGTVGEVTFEGIDVIRVIH